MKKSRNTSASQGFTIVELMISTVIFSLIMVICLTGLVQISRAYYKGITLSRTQEAGRNIMDEISQTIQLSGSAVSSLPPLLVGPNIPEGNLKNATGVFCAGNKKYSFAIDRKVVNSPSTAEINESKKEIQNAMMRTEEKCTDSMEAEDLTATVTGSQRSLLGENMRLTNFSVTPVVANDSSAVKSNGQLWQIDVSIAYGDQDLLDYTDDSGKNRVICRSGTGAEFCSIVELTKIVSRRVQ